MLDSKGRNLLENLLSPYLKGLIKLKVSPNQLTLLGLGLALVASFLLTQSFDLLALFFWWFSRFFDGLDGLLARKTSRSSAFGAYLDIVCDMTAYSSMIMAFFLRYPELGLYWLFILFGYILCITTALSFASLKKNSERCLANKRLLSLADGLAEASETNMIYTVMILFPQGIFFFCILWIFILLLTVVLRTLAAFESL